jgi:adenine-specific DNA-methyltransferase
MKTIQYMGSKKSLTLFLEFCLCDYIGLPYFSPKNKINSYLRDKNISIDRIANKDTSIRQHFQTPYPITFFDAFAGSGSVAYHFSDFFRVITNDKQEFTDIIIKNYLKNENPKEFYMPFVEQLNNLSESDFLQSDEWFTKMYGSDKETPVRENGLRAVWQSKNSKKIDAIRHKISEWKNSRRINDTEESVLLFSLMYAASKVSNTLGHQNGYLKNWSPSSYNDLIMEVTDLKTNHIFNHKSFVGDIFENLNKINDYDIDIAYIDPPYGTDNETLKVATRYSAFYHLWNTLVTNERPEVYGKANKPTKTKGYTEPLEKNVLETVKPKFEELLNKLKCKVVAISYSNKGLMEAKDFRDILENAGYKNIVIYSVPHRSNSQSRAAKKDGEYIQARNSNSELKEWLVLANKIDD